MPSASRIAHTGSVEVATVHASVAGGRDWTGYEATLAVNAERDGGPDALAYARRIRHRRALPTAPTAWASQLSLWLDSIGARDALGRRSRACAGLGADCCCLRGLHCG